MTIGALGAIDALTPTVRWWRSLVSFVSENADAYRKLVEVFFRLYGRLEFEALARLSPGRE